MSLSVLEFAARILGESLQANTGAAKGSLAAGGTRRILLVRPLNLSNTLTVSRIFLVPLLVVVLLTRFPNKEFIGVAIFLAAAVTDWLDGYFARKRNEVTALGTWLDPVADKLLVASAFIALVEMQLVPAWIVVIIVGRELAVSGLRNVALAQGFAIEVSGLGKTKMVMQVFAISSIILGIRFETFQAVGRWALWLVVFFALVSAGQYFRRFWSKVDSPGKRWPLQPPLLSFGKQRKGDVPNHQ